MIHFHGAWKPTGWQRTYPNLMNHEGSLNLEYLKWSDRCTPEHDLLMSFTRLIAGPMDYHLGGFRALPRDKFTAQNIPNVLGTRPRMLAMYVCFDNPNPDGCSIIPPLISASPVSISSNWSPPGGMRPRCWRANLAVCWSRPGAKAPPGTLGGMSAKEARDLSIPLSFLRSGRAIPRASGKTPPTRRPSQTT